MKKYLLILALLPALLFGQNNADSLKFEIIKGTVSFLSLDKKAGGSNRKKVTCSNQDYNCLLKFCSTNDIKEAKENFAIWKAVECKSKDDLSLLAALIISEISTLKGKEYRKNSMEFKTLKSNLDQLVKSCSVAAEPIALPIEDKKIENPPANVEVQNPERIIENPTKNAEKGILPLFALLIGIISLILSVYTFFMVKSITTSKNDSNSSTEISEIKTDIKDLYSKLRQKVNSDYIIPTEERVKTLENRLIQLENPPKQVEPLVTRQYVNTPITDTTLGWQILFAKLPDLGNGFSQSILLSTQNGEQIFEIKISGDKASFSISEDVNAQKYALSDFNYYLSNACEFLNQPVKNCRITTYENGYLLKSSGNWLIQNKAKIEFK